MSWYQDYKHVIQEACKKGLISGKEFLYYWHHFAGYKYTKEEGEELSDIQQDIIDSLKHRKEIWCLLMQQEEEEKEWAALPLDIENIIKSYRKVPPDYLTLCDQLIDRLQWVYEEEIIRRKVGMYEQMVYEHMRMRYGDKNKR